MGVVIIKKILNGVAALLMVSSVGFASPLTDYSQGKVALDVLFRPSADLNLYGYSYDGRNDNWGYGLTVGLGNKFALQYRNSKDDAKAETDISSYLNQSCKNALTAQEYNVLYQLDKGLSAFAGVTNIKAAQDVYFSRDTHWISMSGPVMPAGSSILEKSITGYQVGVIGSTQIGDKMKAYGVVGVGNHIENYEIGLGYEVVKNVEVNVGYRETTYKKMKISYKGIDSDAFDYKVKGMSYGITYKF